MTNHYGNPFVTSSSRGELMVNWAQTLPHRRDRLSSYEQLDATYDSHFFGGLEAPHHHQSTTPEKDNQTFHNSWSHTPYMMNSSLSSNSSVFSWQSNSFDSDKMQRSSSSIGLPSEYPLHRKSSSIDSAFIFDDLDDIVDFDLGGMGETPKSSKPSHPLYKRPSTTSSQVLQSSLLFLEEETSVSDDLSLSTASLTSSKKPTHRRSNRSVISSSAHFHEMLTASKKKRRQRNRALTAEEFDEMILDGLFLSEHP